MIAMQKLIAMCIAILLPYLYGMSAYVAEVDRENDMVCFRDYATEHDWWIEGDAENYAEFDDCVLIMYDNMTPENRLDDWVIKATREQVVDICELLKGVN